MTKKELRVRGLRLHEEPIADRHNKFVINEEGDWFLPFEDHANTPPLAEILIGVLRIDPSDEEGVAEVDARLQDERVLLGYVSGEVRNISVHSLPDSHDVVRRRLMEVVGTKLSDAVRMGTQTEVRG